MSKSNAAHIKVVKKKPSKEEVLTSLVVLHLQKGDIIPHDVIARCAGTPSKMAVEAYGYEDIEHYKLALMTVSNLLYREFGLLAKVRKNKVIIQADAEAVDYEYNSFRLAESKMRRRRHRYKKIDTNTLSVEMKKLKEAREREMVIKLQYLKKSSKDY
jgi:hypothetical protein